MKFWSISGGVVAIIIHNPDLLLLDEPFSNLDQNLKEKVQENLKEIIKGCVK